MSEINKLYSIFLSSEGISTDSRQPSKNTIFFALKGSNFNGNRFARDAIQNGCICAVIDDPSIVADENYFLVEDTLKALQNLAIYHRKKLNIPVIGLTGSNGKTTTRELITSILSKKYNALSTRGNLNNHIGVPLTILSIRNHEIAVIEMGANHPGEIKRLCQIAQPNFGIITNIGKAHLEGFGSPEGVKRTKKELYDYLEETDGTAFVNYSNPILKELTEKSGLKKVIYGNDKHSICDGKSIGKDIMLSVEAKWSYNHQKGSAKLHTKLAGSYNLENVITAVTVGLYFNVDMDDIKSAVYSYMPTNNRSQILTKGSNQLILDAYNANPSSMLNALKNFTAYKHDKKMVILGDMLELGGFSEQEHMDILQYLKNYPEIDACLVGKEFFRADKNLLFKTFLNTAALSEFLEQNPVTDTLILIKGSRGLQLETIIDFI